VTASTPKEEADKLKAMDSEVKAMRSTSGQLPTKVPPIDWAHWKRTIRTPGVVDKLQAEYEATKFPEGTKIDLDKFNKFWDARIKIAEDFAEEDRVFAEDLSKWKSELEEIKRTRWWWGVDEYLRRFPGLKEQLDKEYVEFPQYYKQKEAEETLEEMDPNEFRKALAEGRELPFPEGLSSKLGDLDIDEVRNQKSKRNVERKKREDEALAALEKAPKAQ